MKFILTHRLALIGVVVGSIAGYLYYYYVGCVTGTCPITSKPFNSVVYGAIMGSLLFSMFNKEKTKAENT